jgi:hypothetical protein
MSLRNQIFILISILLLLILACSAPVLSVTPTVRPKLIFPSATVKVSPTGTSVPTNTISPTGSPTPLSAQETLTPAVLESATPIEFPRITFERNTNCRIGPAVNYFMATSYFKDRSTFAEGRNADTSWLWVRTNAPEQHCWVSIANIKAPETYTYLPVVSFPSLPGAPAQFFVEKKTCGPRNTIIVQWSNISGETGFHFYRNGIMLSLLKEDTFRFIDYPPLAKEYSYEIEAINNYGLSVRVPLKVFGCAK